MKTTTYIIGDKEFSLEDSATKKLDYYRTAIADHFSGQDTEEAINDIDLAIIEKLEAKLKKRTDKTIILSDIEELIRQLGTIEQITDQTEQGEDTIIVSKKLYRNMKNRWVGGVCSGLAAYMGIPIWIVRVAFLIAIPAPIPSVLPYLILWFLVPPTQNKADELQMHGIPVSLSSLSNTKGYTRKKVIGLAKWLGILMGILALLLAAIMGTALMTFIWSSSDDATEHGTILYNYSCENSSENVVMLMPKHGNSSVMIGYGDTTQEYKRLYQKPDEVAFGGATFPFSEKLQFTIGTTDRDMNVFDRDLGESIDDCEVISVQKGSTGISDGFKELKDFIAIDECLDQGSVWDYKERRCLPNDSKNSEVLTLCDENGNRYVSEKEALDTGLEYSEFGATYCREYKMHPSWDANSDGLNDCEKDNTCDDSVDYSTLRNQ